MSAKHPIIKKKKARKTAAKLSPPLQPTGNSKTATVSKDLSASRTQAAGFELGVTLNQLGNGATSRDFPRGALIFSQGERANAVYYVQAGTVKLTVVSQRGKEAVVAILPEASFFGEGSLAGQPVRMSSASALQRSTIIRVEKQAMLELLHRNKEFAEDFLSYLLARNIRMESDLVDHLFNSSEKRLARLLLLMANFGQESKPIPVIAKMSQETLAEMIGTTRSRVSFFLNRFRELGFIDYNGGGMHVHSSLIGVVLHD